MQLPVVHCAFEVHAVASATVPHDPFTQGAPTQSPSLPQVVAHVAPEHLNGAHVTAGAAGQVPAPLHVDALETMFVVGSHVAALHGVAFGQSWQLPVPSHRPFSPQVDAAVDAQVGWVASGAVPAGTGEHVPT
jgi:hypothetical protein